MNQPLTQAQHPWFTKSDSVRLLANAVQMRGGPQVKPGTGNGQRRPSGLSVEGVRPTDLMTPRTQSAPHDTRYSVESRFTSHPAALCDMMPGQGLPLCGPATCPGSACRLQARRAGPTPHSSTAL